MKHLKHFNFLFTLAFVSFFVSIFFLPLVRILQGQVKEKRFHQGRQEMARSSRQARNRKGFGSYQEVLQRCACDWTHSNEIARS